jgi:hypothetical protein
MRSSASRQPTRLGWAVDTSVAVAYLEAGHAAHLSCVEALGGRVAALAGHAAFESYSVLTRLPDPLRVAAADARSALDAAFPERCWLRAGGIVHRGRGGRGRRRPGQTPAGPGV